MFSFFTHCLPFTHLIRLDIVFQDAHTLWAQHSSGTFTQLDLWHSYKPIDVIPRVSVAWEAGGGVHVCLWEVEKVGSSF